MLSGNSSALGFSQLDLTRCGIGFAPCSLYPPLSERIVTQFCGVGVAFGAALLVSSVGGEFSDLYFEGNTADMWFIAGPNSNNYGVITSTQEANLANIQTLSPRQTSNLLVPLYQGLTNWTVNLSGRLYQYDKQGFNGTEIGSVINLFILGKNQQFNYYKNTAVFNIKDVGADANRLFGYDSATLKLAGSNAGNVPTSATFNPPAGATVNGTTTAVFTNFQACPAEFLIYWQAATNNYIVSLLQNQAALILPTAVTITASPMVYQNTKGYPMDLLVSGGTVSLIEFSRNGSTFYPTGTTAGPQRLGSGDRARITYSSSSGMALTAVPR